MFILNIWNDMITLHHNLAATLKIGTSALVLGALFAQPYRPMVVVGRSMEPTYANHLVTLTQPVKVSELRRGQVVVIKMDYGTIVKRIAFLAGDKMTQAKVGNQWMDMLSVHPTSRSKRDVIPMRKVVVPAGEAYVLGDNQNVSLDSRDFGFIREDQIERLLVDQRPPPVGKSPEY